MSTFLRNNTISKMTPLWKEIPFPQFNVASYKRPGIRLSFEDMVGHWEELVQLRCLEKFSVTIQFSLETVLSKIVGTKCILWQKKFQTTLRTSTKLWGCRVLNKPKENAMQPKKNRKGLVQCSFKWFSVYLFCILIFLSLTFSGFLLS